MGPTREFYSLQSQIILSFLLAVFLTAAVGGLPTLWLIRQQMDQQAWAQVDTGQHAALTQYAAWQSRLSDLARLTAQRPTLAAMLGQGDTAGLMSYLDALQSGEGVDLILVCDGQGQPVAATAAGPYNTAGLCQLPQGGAYTVDTSHVPARVWLLAAHPLDLPGEDGAQVVVGIHLDGDFVLQMKELTGLEHTLYVDGLVAVSSYGAQPQNLVTVEPGMQAVATPPEGVCCTFELDERPYYAARLPLEETGVTSGAEFEVALPVGGIEAAQRSLFAFIALSIAVVALIGSLIGIMLARRISRPLVQLAGEASRLSTGDLDTPITVDSRINEVVQVSRALEGARDDLASTLANLQKEKAWVNHLLESIVEGIVTLDERCRVRFFSHGAERITGWSREEVIGKRCDEVFKLVGDGSPDYGDIASFSESLPAAGQRTRLLVSLPEDRQVTLSITRAELSPAGAGSGEVALVFRDVSETETIRRLLGYFLANVTHEFRTPLSALAASIELLMDQAPDLTQAEMDELLKSLHLGVLGLQNLVDNLLESASIEAGHFRVSPRPYDLEAIVIDAVGTMQPILDKYEQQLYVDLADDLPEVQADPRRVAQVLVNLLSNASKYGPSDAEIILSARQEGPWVRVEVADRGPGISNLHRELLFRRFEYPANVDTQSKVGAGLGLSVVKTIVEGHGGQAGVENRLGGGSIFWFTLPVVRGV